MRKPSLVAVAVLAALLLAAGGALYAYDASRSDVIATGVTLAGVDAGGMTVAEARAALRRQLVPRLERPLVVVYRDRTFVLPASDAGVRVDVDGMAQAALEESRRGNFLARAFRDLGGGSVEANIAPRVNYSEERVGAFVRRVARAVDRPARDAAVEPSVVTLRRLPARNGIRVRTRELALAIASRLVRPEARRVVPVPTEVVEPDVTAAELPEKYPAFITISRREKKLRLFERLRLAKVYVIAVGRLGFSTPAGLYEVQDMAANPAWYVPNEAWAGKLAGKVIPPGSPQNPIKARWMGFSAGRGIHGTDAIESLGTAASHGCIRMSIPDVIELYERVEVGTPIAIA